MHLADMSHEVAWEGRHFFVRAMSELHRFGWESTRERARHLAAPFRSLDASSSRLDSTLRLTVTSLAKLGRRIVRRQVLGEDWHLAIRPRDPGRGSPLSEPVSWTTRATASRSLNGALTTVSRTACGMPALVLAAA